MKSLRKNFLATIFILSLFLVSPSLANSQVNIITNKDHAGFAANQNLNQTVVYAPNPNDVDSIVEVCQQAQVCVIRGHTNWTNDGNIAIAGQAGAVAQRWGNTLDQAAGQLGKVIYFEPWNEPMRRDLECNNLSVEQCVSRLTNYVQLLRNNISSSQIKITSPAIDMHHPETPAFFNAWGSSFANSFDVYSIHIYAPDIACPSGGRYFKNQLNNYGVNVGNKRFIITESGALTEGNYGSPIYEEKNLCEFYCSDCNGQTIVENWINDAQVLGYALFSLGPEGLSWNLWAADCVKNSLQGTCACSTCPEAEDEDLDIIDEMWSRDGRKPSSDNSLFGLGDYFGPSSVNNSQSFLQLLLSSFKEFFNISQGTYAPTHSEGEYPGDDGYRGYYRKNEIITLPGTVAQVCLEGRDIKQNFKFFPDHHNPDEVVIGLLNLTGQNHRVAQSLQAYLDIHHWASGSVFSDKREFIDADNEEGMEKLVRRGLNLNAGHQTKAIPGEMQTDLINQEMEQALGAAANIPQEEEEIAVFDQPIALMGDGGMLKEDEENTQQLDDGRQILETGGGRYEVKGSLWACCNPDFFEDKPYTYEQACSDIANDWICKNGEPAVPGDIIYGPYVKGKYLADYFTGGGDLPTYYETCYREGPEKAPEHEDDKVFNNFFINMSPSERYRAFPVTGENDCYLVHQNDYWACQIAKIYLPDGLSALNACDKMMKNEISGEMYENLTKNYPERKEFPCDMGNLPKTDGPTTNLDASRSTDSFGQMLERLLGVITKDKVDSCEVKYDTYTETRTVIDPDTGEEVEQEIEKKMARYCDRQNTIESRSSLIIPFYQKFEQCSKFLYGYLDGETADSLHQAIKQKTGKDTDPYNLFELAQGNGPGGVYSGKYDYTKSRKEHYEEKPDGIKVQSSVGGESFKLPGSVDIPQKASQKRFYPGEVQNNLGI